MQLPRTAADTKRCGIYATEGIGKHVVIRVCRRDGSTDVYAGGSVLCDRARGSGAFCEHRGVFYVRDGEGDRNAIAATIAIISRHRYRIRHLGLKV